MSYYVLRTYSRTDRRKLWKVESRPFSRKGDAESWCEFERKQWVKEHPKTKAVFFVVDVSHELK
jgi:hypothetical protein